MKGINLHKAGMEGLDAGTIDKIIEENSKGSKFYENEMRHGAILKRQVEEKLAKLRCLTHSEIDVGEKEADKLLRSYSAERRFDKCIVHIDMDAFYAAVEMRDNPSLRLKPLAVGSQSMLSTSNYLARRFGVRAAMPGFLGMKLCPQLTIVPPDFVKYTEVSRAVRAVLTEYCDDGLAGLVVMSLDEVYLNITQHLRERAEWPPERRTHWPRLAPKTPMLVCRCSKNKTKSNLSDLVVTLSPSKSPTKLSAADEVRKGRSAPPSIVSLQIGKDEELATCLLCGMLIRPGCRVFGTSAGEAVREMRFRVFCATRLTCSAGIAPNSLIAKIASDWNKPNGQLLVEPTAEAVEAFISPLPIRKVPGIGYVTECRLKAFGVERIADIRERRGVLFHLVSRTALAYYMRISLGHSEDDWVHSTASAVAENAGSCCASQKSMGVERTFRDCADPKILQAKCGQLCASLVDDMKEAHVQGKTVTMKFKLDSFEVRSRSQTLADYTCSAAIISQCASEILKDEMKAELMDNSKPLCLRLMGVRISNLVPSAMCQCFRQETLEAAFNKGFVGVETMDHDCSIPAASSDRTHRNVPPRRSSPLANENEPCAAPAQRRVLTTCPACSKQLQLKDLEDINEHLDACLSRQTIWDAVQETFPSTKPVTSKSPSTRSKRVSHPTRSTSIVGPLDKYFKMG